MGCLTGLPLAAQPVLAVLGVEGLHPLEVVFARGRQGFGGGLGDRHSGTGSGGQGGIALVGRIHRRVKGHQDVLARLVELDRDLSPGVCGALQDAVGLGLAVFHFGRQHLRVGEGLGLTGVFGQIAVRPLDGERQVIPLRHLCRVTAEGQQPHIGRRLFKGRLCRPAIVGVIGYRSQEEHHLISIPHRDAAPLVF